MRSQRRAVPRAFGTRHFRGAEIRQAPWRERRLKKTDVGRGRFFPKARQKTHERSGGKVPLGTLFRASADLDFFNFSLVMKKKS